MWQSLYRSSMIKYATQRIGERFYETSLPLQYLNFAISMKFNNKASILDTLLSVTTADMSLEIFESYIACCLYADGLDFLLNKKNLNELKLITNIKEYFDIQEVSFRAIFIAIEMSKAYTEVN